MDDIKELEKEYYELAKSPILHSFEVVDEKPKIEKVEFNDLVKRKDLNPIDVRERVNWLERRVDEFEKTLSLVNKNFDDHRRMINEKLGKLEKRERIPPEVRSELSSLKSLIEKTMSVNEEIKTKTPLMLRDLESKVNNFDSRIGIFDEELKKIKEESKKDYWTRPVILE